MSEIEKTEIGSTWRLESNKQWDTVFVSFLLKRCLNSVCDFATKVLILGHEAETNQRKSDPLPPIIMCRCYEMLLESPANTRATTPGCKTSSATGHK